MSFPNSERLLRTAFAQPNPSSALLDLIKQNPTYPAVVDLVLTYTTLVDENPTRAEALASILLHVRDAPDSDAPTSISGLPIPEIFSCELADIHEHDLRVNDATKTLGPSNFFLTSSFLSGLSFKHELTSAVVNTGSFSTL
ncbi:hypothetical protein BDN70DRAFT_881402 [Pholiota conissans]|uniref:Uncharacterized protein n=1 Tax=Pholiota conissans TaxID=109636 RepID=A0A9P6CSF6_9AGAR|nr:hypothetical protein BDN70DRAFT_881402 [Pholiota conissans]